MPRYEEYAGSDPLAFVFTKNLHRRHLSESQRAMVASNLANMKVGNHSQKGPESNSANLPNSDPPVSRAKAAEMLKASERLVGTAKAVERTGVPELIEQVKTGKAVGFVTR